jgi:hypothetical protein
VEEASACDGTAEADPVTTSIQDILDAVPNRDVEP